jgi:hypothetical protein
MRKSTDSFVWAMSLLLVVGALTAARAEEPKCNCPQMGVPVLSGIPYISRLFKNVGVTHNPECTAAECTAAECTAGKCTAGKCTAGNCTASGYTTGNYSETKCAEEWERIGIDFDLPACPEAEVFHFGPVGVAWAVKADADCRCREACRCEGACKCAPAVCHAVAIESAECGAACGKAVACAATCETRCAANCAATHPMWEKFVALVAERAAAQATLEAHIAAREEQSELLDALVEMSAKTAGLEARLEAQTEHSRLTEQMLELAVENARLKSQVELAEAKEKLLQTTVPVAVERELLARRVAELEEKLSAGSEGVRAARKAGGKQVK